MNNNFKSAIIITVSIIIFVAYDFSLSQWEMILPPSPTSNQLVSLDFIDETTGWAVGEYGTILKTTDGGETWRLIEIPQLDYLTDVYFPTALIGYIVGKDGIILKSTDGGESWFPQTVQFTNNLHRVRFRNENTGWIIGEKGLILYTTDGGTNWKQQISNCREDLNGFSFVGDSCIWIVGKNKTILTASTEAANWKPITNIDIKSHVSGPYHFNDIYFLNNRFGWIVGTSEEDMGEGNFIAKTTNGGGAWSEILPVDYDHESFNCGGGGLGGIQQIHFSDAKTGLCLIGRVSRLSFFLPPLNVPLFTDDGGKKWFSQLRDICGASNQAGRFFFLSKNKVINTGYRSEFRFSNDKGLTWDYSNAHKRNFWELIIGQNGQLLGQQQVWDEKSEAEVHIWSRSKDFGRNWQNFTPQFFYQDGNPGRDVKLHNPVYCILNRETLWTVCYQKDEEFDTIFKSTDFGRTWHWGHDSVSKSLIWPRHFLTPDTIIGYRLEQVKVSPNEFKAEMKFSCSFDGGRTVLVNRFQNIWNEINPYEFFWDARFISDNYFFTSQIGFLIGSEGNIIKTTDTGQSWQVINSGVTENLWDITFINRKTGFVVGDFGRILKTQDGGQTWRKTDSGTQEDVYSIGFKNEQEGWAGTETGLLHTTDRGETWQRVPMRYIHGPIREIEFDKDGTGYAYTHKFYPNEDLNSRPGGYILLLVLKEGGVEVAHPKPVSPYSFTLHPNYPNPFNSTTIFRFSLPETEAVTLTIYNIRGQRVHTLVDKSLESGEHEVIWNGTNQAGQAVASGVYVARLRWQGEVKTRKVVVLR